MGVIAIGDRPGSGAACYVGHRDCPAALRGAREAAFGEHSGASPHRGVGSIATPLSWVRKLRPPESETHRSPWVEHELQQLDLEPKNTQ